MSQFNVEPAVSAWRGKTVLLVSPQCWGHIRVSKHNYAVALASCGARVVFLNPPDSSLETASAWTDDVVPGVDVLTMTTPWFYRLRFHVRWLFEWLMNRRIRSVLADHKVKPDVVWCFEFNLYGDLDVFGAAQSIFHPVDPLSQVQHTDAAGTADLVLTVSDRIAAHIRTAGHAVTVINHGLATPFRDAAMLALGSALTEGDRICVGYAGNLAIPSINRDVIRTLVEQHLNVDFQFWGPHASNDQEANRFIAFLQDAPNATVHGAVSQTELVAGFRQVDIFLLCYAMMNKGYDRSNSHKLLEYLSTGNVIVSSRIQQYEAHEHLLAMSATDDDADLSDIFSNVVANLSEFNAASLRRSRIELALANTYDRHLTRIAELLVLQPE